MIAVWCPRERVNPGVWIAIFLVAILAINYFGISFFGELEFWLSTIKVLVILGIILMSVILAAGGGPNHHATGFYYWSHPGGTSLCPIACPRNCWLLTVLTSVQTNERRFS